MVRVDIKTRTLPAGHKLYMVRPGTAYHLLGASFENQVIAPDLPFLSVPDGVRPRDQADINYQIKRAREFSNWVKTEDSRAGRLPSADIAQYAQGDLPARVAMYRNTADEILHSLPVGSLIFTPNPDLTKNGMFGELSDPMAPRVQFNGTGHRQQFRYQGRRLENVKFLPMRKLPKQMFPPMRKRLWIHEYGRAETELVYRQFYGDFEVIGRKSVSEITVTRERVTGTDLSIIGALTTLIDQTLARVERGDDARLSMSDAVFLPPDPHGPLVHAQIGSPGEVLIESIRRRVSPVLKVIVALCIVYSAHDIWEMVQAGELFLINSQAVAGMGVDQLADTQTKTYDFITSTGRDSLVEIVDLVRDVNGRTGGGVDAIIYDDE